MNAKVTTDNDGNSSLSSESLQLGDEDVSPASLRHMEAKTKANAKEDKAKEKITSVGRTRNTNIANGGYSSEEDNIDVDLELGELSDDVIELTTDDEQYYNHHNDYDNENDNDDEETTDNDDFGLLEQAVDATDDGIRDSILYPEKTPATTDKPYQVTCHRVTVLWSFILSAAGTAILTWLHISDRLPLPEGYEEWLLPIIVAVPYLIVVLAVCFLDRTYQQTIRKLQHTAKKNTAIVNSLFPENVRSRMLKHETNRLKQERKKKSHQSLDYSTDSGKDIADTIASMEEAGGTSLANGSFQGSWSGVLSLGSRSKGSCQDRRKERRQRRKGQKQKQPRKGRKPDVLAAAAAAFDATASPANQTLETSASQSISPSSPLPESRPNALSASTSTISKDDDEYEEGLIPKDILTTKPIADFFPHCTVLFADIVGFTAWSSVRDPTAVFTLLESLYSCFDGIARRLKVFKVETIGDCYVAVTGLPDPMEQHAVVMAQFARSCMFKMLQIVRALEKHLGPDTGDLSMRFGLHSGPVTAGVMRGEKSRFQLFGDTVNTAARIESTGERDKIHLSAEAADQIAEAGKQHWVEPREEKIQAKGKGKLQTYWLVMGPNSKKIKTSATSVLNDSASSLRMASASASSDGEGSNSGNFSFRGGGVNNLVAMFEKTEKLNTLGERTRRQASYTVEVLTQILKKLVAQRRGSQPIPAATPVELARFAKMEATVASRQRTPLQEVNDAIDFSKYLKVSSSPKSDKIKVPRNVLDQMEDFVTTIASMYRDHAFHCWEHASHVTISLTKLFSRLVTAKNGSESSISSRKQWGRLGGKAKNGPSPTSSKETAAFGIPNDAMAEFALVFAAMIHDIDHPGIPNAKIIRENTQMVQKYGRKSPSEQNSMDVAWEVFQRPAYQELRRHIYSTEEEMSRFRQLVVTLVMATDMMDRDKAKERNKRWERVFTKKAASDADTNNRKATLVLETMIQVSNIAHCVQHWNVYHKWNKKLFQEMCEAYSAGRQSGQKDPADFWFQGELAFFDDVVIPLANKLHECGAFGDDAEEFLAYAKSNQRDFRSKGREVVLDYLSETRGGTGSDMGGLRGIKSSALTYSSSSNMNALWSSDDSIKFKAPRSTKWKKPTSTSSTTFSSMGSVSDAGTKPVSTPSNSSRPPNPRRSPTP